MTKNKELPVCPIHKMKARLDKCIVTNNLHYRCKFRSCEYTTINVISNTEAMAKRAWIKLCEKEMDK